MEVAAVTHTQAREFDDQLQLTHHFCCTIATPSLRLLTFFFRSQAVSAPNYSIFDFVPTISPANSEFDFEALVLEGFKNQHLEDELNLFSLSPFSSPDSSPPLPSISLPSSSSPHPSSSSSNRTFIPRQAIPSRAKRQSRKNRKKKRQAAKCKEGVDETEMGQPRPDALKLHVGRSTAFETGLDSEAKLVAASTGYVGIRQRARRTLYKLEILTGPRSSFGLKLYDWDGM